MSRWKMKITVEIQDDWRKMQRELEILKNTWINFDFLFFHNTFFQ